MDNFRIVREKIADLKVRDYKRLLQPCIDVQRTVFTLRYYDEMKYSEISEILGTSEGSLKASYHIAVQKITDYVKRYE